MKLLFKIYHRMQKKIIYMELNFNIFIINNSFYKCLLLSQMHDNDVDYKLKYYTIIIGYPTPPPTRKQGKRRNRHSRMQGKRSKVRNFPSQEHKQSKNHCSPVK